MNLFIRTILSTIFQVTWFAEQLIHSVVYTVDNDRLIYNIQLYWLYVFN